LVWCGGGGRCCAGAVAFCCLAGAEAPGVNDLLNRLPLFNIAVNARLIAFAAMGICVLAAMGLEHAGVWLFLGTAVVLAIQPEPRELIPLLLAIALIKAFPNRKAVALLALLLVQRTSEIGGGGQAP